MNEFIKNNIEVFKTIQVGFIKNLDEKLLTEFETIYKENIDKGFVLQHWCNSCVFSMMKRLYEWHLTTIQVSQFSDDVQIETQIDDVKKSKSKRVKK